MLSAVHIAHSASDPDPFEGGVQALNDLWSSLNCSSGSTLINEHEQKIGKYPPKNNLAVTSNGVSHYEVNNTWYCSLLNFECHVIVSTLLAKDFRLAPCQYMYHLWNHMKPSSDSRGMSQALSWLQVVQVVNMVERERPRERERERESEHRI